MNNKNLGHTKAEKLADTQNYLGTKRILQHYCKNTYQGTASLTDPQHEEIDNPFLVIDG